MSNGRHPSRLAKFCHSLEPCFPRPLDEFAVAHFGTQAGKKGGKKLTMRAIILTIIALLLLLILVSFDKGPAPTSPESKLQRQTTSGPRTLS